MTKTLEELFPLGTTGSVDLMARQLYHSLKDTEILKELEAHLTPAELAEALRLQAAMELQRLNDLRNVIKEASQHETLDHFLEALVEILTKTAEA